MADKVLLINNCAEKAKYGAVGYRKMRDAISRLVKADRTRGLKTVVIDLSNPLQMKKYKAAAISDHRSEVQNKNAIDAVYAAIQPHYLVLIDGPDVIPHIRLKNPIPNQDDKDVPSDLPYASDEPFITRDAAAYARVTRVVGRIPGVTGTSDASFLASQIKNAASFKSGKREDYLSYFAISSYDWRKSTEISIENIFRSGSVKISPPANSSNIARMLTPLSHFINCDGKKGAPKFFGRRGSTLVTSITSDEIAKGVNRNTIVAAESCFGAQLFAPSVAHGKLPIANAYLNAGAIAFFGSTTIAYGSRRGNGGADVIAQYFLSSVLEKASVGRAVLQARQRFVSTQKMESPVSVKTLAQFILLGDPSLQPIAYDGPQRVFQREAVGTRRVALAAAGEAVASCSGFPRTKIKKRTQLHKQVRAIALRSGFKLRATSVDGYKVIGGKSYAKAMNARNVTQSVFVVTESRSIGGRKLKSESAKRILVAHAQNSRLTGVFEYVQR